MTNITNGSLSLSFDQQGLISSLKGVDGQEQVWGPGLWRIIYSRGEDLERELLAQDTPLVSLDSSGTKAVVVHESELVKVRIEARLENGLAVFDATVENKADIVVREFQFFHCDLGQLADVSLLWGNGGGGELLQDLPEVFRRHHSNYMGQDDMAITVSSVYPGAHCSTNCFVLLREGGGLYFGSHDPSFQNTLHQLRRSDDGVRPLLGKYPFLKQGETARLEGFVVAPFQGTWHEAAKIYRSWAETWYQPPTPPKWIRDFNGWQRLILRHQYGQTFFTYAELPDKLADGAAVGIDSILLFAWWNDGMDAGYPDYRPAPDLGGLEALKSGIAKTQAKGGKVMLYFNGQLIDKASEFYKTTGHNAVVRDMRGQEHTEAYNFSGAGSALRQFGNRVFATGCFSCHEWVDVLKSCVDFAIEAGADGVFFDQFGYRLWPCWDPSHGHRVPDMAGFETKAKVVEMLSAYAKAKKPGMAFGTEWINDRLAPHVDFFHTVNTGYEQGNFLEWFRYCFPEVQISDRGIRDDKGDFKHRVNHAVQMGLKSDVEIFRCRATIAAAPKYGAYLAQANALRQELKDFLCAGQFLDDVPFSLSNPKIRAKSFRSGERLLVVAAHREAGTLKGELTVPGHRYEGCKGLGNYVVDNKGGKLELELPAESLAALLFTA